MEDDFENNMDQTDMTALGDREEEDEADKASGTIATYVQERFSKASTARET